MKVTARYEQQLAQQFRQQFAHVNEVASLQAEIRTLKISLGADPWADRSRAYSTRRARIGAVLRAHQETRARTQKLKKLAELRAQLKALTNPSQGARP